MEKEEPFQQIVLGQLDPHAKNEAVPLPAPYTKTNFKWIISLNVRTKTTYKIHRNNIEINLCDPGLGKTS